MKNKYKLILLAATLIATTLSCNFPVKKADLAVDETPIYLALPGSLDEIIEESGQIDPSTGSISVSFSEDNLSGYLNTYLVSQTDLNIKNASVKLNDGRINILGKYTQGFLSTDIKLSLDAGVDSSGRLFINIVEADLGPIPAPENFRNTISSLIEESLDDYLAAGVNGMNIEQLTISEGLLTVSGK